MDNRGRILAMTLGSFLAFLVFGCIDILKGATLFAVLDETGYRYSVGGVIVMASYFGFMVSALASGVIAERVGKKNIMIAAALFFMAGVGGYSIAHSLPMFLFSFFLVGLGCGSAELGCNFIIVDVQRRNPGLYLNLLAACFGLGSMLAPLYSGQMFKAGFTWREIYQYILIAPFLMFVYFVVTRYPGSDAPPTKPPGVVAMLKTAFSGHLRWFYVLAFSYVAAETCVGHWIVEYLRVVRNLPAETGQNWLSLFFACIMTGRLVGGFVVERIGYVRSMATAVLAVMMALLLGIYGPGGFAWLLPLSGLCYAVILPTATALLSTVGRDGIGSMLGLLCCFIGLGGMAGPWVTGLVNDWLGLRAGLTVAVLFCLVMLLSVKQIHEGMRRGLQER